MVLGSRIELDIGFCIANVTAFDCFTLLQGFAGDRIGELLDLRLHRGASLWKWLADYCKPYRRLPEDINLWYA